MQTQLIYEGDFDVPKALYTWPVQHGPTTVCGLEVYTCDELNIVIVTEKHDNPGASITNAIEDIGACVSTQFSLDPDTTLFIERYDRESYDRVHWPDPEQHNLVRYTKSSEGVLSDASFTPLPYDVIHGYTATDIFTRLAPYLPPTKTKKAITLEEIKVKLAELTKLHKSIQAMNENRFFRKPGDEILTAIDEEHAKQKKLEEQMPGFSLVWIAAYRCFGIFANGQVDFDLTSALTEMEK